jgi:hypothetical protein
VSGISGVTLLPVGENFCEDGICSMTIGSSILFRDNNHLNLKGSRFLAGKLAEVTAFAKAVEPVPRGVDVVGTWGGLRRLLPDPKRRQKLAIIIVARLNPYIRGLSVVVPVISDADEGLVDSNAASLAGAGC